MLSILLQIIAASRIYWVDLDISTKMVHFMTVLALFLGIFGQFSVFELYLNSTRPIFSDFSGVFGYFILHFITLGDENKTKKGPKLIRYPSTMVHGSTK